MVITLKEIQGKSETINRNLKNAERLIDSELKQNADRLKEGKEVMIPCVMPFEIYKGLIEQYCSKGWQVRHEANYAYGRLYFKAN